MEGADEHGGAPPPPGGPPPPPPSDLPPVRWRHPGVPRGATVALDGADVHNNTVDVRLLSQVLDHFERLVRVLRAHNAGLEVKRRGRLVDVRGAGRLVAAPALEGSFVMPLLLASSDGELLADD